MAARRLRDPIAAGFPASLLKQGSLRVFVLAIEFFRRNDDGGGDFVVGLEVEDADALGGAASRTDGLGVAADDFSELADDHQLRGLVDKLDGVDAADAIGDGKILDALAAARLEAILLDIGTLAEAVLSDGKNAICARLVLLGCDGDADDVVVLEKRDAADTVSGTAHGADVALVEADGEAEVCGEEDELRTVGETGGDELIVGVHADGEILERSFFDGTFLRGEENEFALFLKIAQGEDGADFLTGLEIEQALHGFALACGADIGNLIDLEPVDTAGVGEAEQVGVRGVDDELRNEVFFARLHAHAASAAAALLPVDGDGGALEVALMADGDGDLLVGDQVFKLDLGALVDDLGAALVSVPVADFFKLFDDDGAQFLFAGEDLFVLGDS